MISTNLGDIVLKTGSGSRYRMNWIKQILINGDVLLQESLDPNLIQFNHSK